MTRLGVVQSVSVNRSRQQVFVSVSVSPRRTHANVPYSAGGAGLFSVPAEGDVVAVEEVSGKYIAYGAFSTTDYTLPETFGSGSVYVENPDGPQFLLSQQSAKITHQDGPSVTVGKDTVDFAGGAIQVPVLSSDPANPEDGQIWYNSSANEYRGQEGGTTVSFDTTTV